MNTKKMEQKIAEEKDKNGQPVNRCQMCKGVITNDKTHCEKCEVLKAEQTARERKESIEKGGINIKIIQREIAFKIKQLETGITETRSIHKIPDGSVVTVDGYVDNLKPEFIIKNELDLLNYNIETYKRQIADIKKAEEEDARETSNSGDKG